MRPLPQEIADAIVLDRDHQRFALMKIHASLGFLIAVEESRAPVERKRAAAVQL